MKVVVSIMPKKSVLDPQGTAVAHAMVSLGYETSRNVRVGRRIEFEIDGEDTPEFRASIDKVCIDLLSNPIIEDYEYELVS